MWLAGTNTSFVHSLFRYPLTTDGEEHEGLLSLHRSHTFQRAKPSPADIHPTLHLRLPKHGTEQCDGDDIVLLLGGVHLLWAPEGRRLYIVDKGISRSSNYSAIVYFARRPGHLSSLQENTFLSNENTCVNTITPEDHTFTSSYFNILPAVSLVKRISFVLMKQKVTMHSAQPIKSSSYQGALWTWAHWGHITSCFCTCTYWALSGFDYN